MRIFAVALFLAMLQGDDPGIQRHDPVEPGLVSGLPVKLCLNHDCSTAAVSYSDNTGTTPCPSNAPVVLAGAAACTGVTGHGGAFGFWLADGIYFYQIINGDRVVHGAILAKRRRPEMKKQ
jgi:hypothetical protein